MKRDFSETIGEGKFGIITRLFKRKNKISNFTKEDSFNQIGEGGYGKVFAFKRKRKNRKTNTEFTKEYVIKSYKNSALVNSKIDGFNLLKSLNVKTFKFYKKLNDNQIVMPNLNSKSNIYVVSYNNSMFDANLDYNELNSIGFKHITNLNPFLDEMLRNLKIISENNLLFESDCIFYIIELKNDSFFLDFIFGDFDSLRLDTNQSPNSIYLSNLYGFYRSFSIIFSSKLSKNYQTDLLNYIKDKIEKETGIKIKD